MKEFLNQESFKKIISANKNLLVLFVSFCVLIFVNFIVFGNLVLAYNQYEQNEAEQMKIQQFFIDYNKKVSKLKSEPHRACTLSQLDQFQTSLLADVRANNLNLVSLVNLSAQNNVNPDAKTVIDHNLFNMTVIGEWVDVCNFIDKLTNSKPLLSVCKVKMKLNDANSVFVRAEIHYKVYLR